MAESLRNGSPADKKGQNWPEKFPLTHRDKERNIPFQHWFFGAQSFSWSATFSLLFFLFFSRKYYFWSNLSSAPLSARCFPVSSTGGRRETLYFYLNFARVAHQTKRTTKSSQTEARRRPLKMSVGANSSLICIAAWELQTLLSTPHAASAKCQVHHHFKPLLVLWLKIKKRKRKSITQHEISANQCARCKLELL